MKAHRFAARCVRPTALEHKNVIVIGEDELKNNEIVVKNMTGEKETNVSLETIELLKIIRNWK